MTSIDPCTVGADSISARGPCCCRKCPRVRNDSPSKVPHPYTNTPNHFNGGSSRRIIQHEYKPSVGMYAQKTIITGEHITMNPTFYNITVCQIITLFGNAALRFALPLYLLRRIDSAALYGSVTALALVPMLLGTLAGGVLADRCRKQKIMAVLDTVSAIGMAAAAVILPAAPVTPLVLAALCLLYAVEGLYQPAVQASLPLLLDGAALARGNAVIQLVDTIDELLGPLLGSVLLHTLELRGLLLLCAVCFAVSALWERTLPIPHAPTARSCLRLPPKALFLRARPLLRLAAVLALLNLAVVPAVTVGVPLLVVRYYAFSDTALAITQSAMSAGGLLGGVLAGAFAKRLSLRRGTAALWCITAVCALLGLAVLPCVPAAAGYIAVTSLAFCMMATAALFQILLFTAIQSHAPTGQTGRFMSLITICACLTQPVGQAALGLLYGRFAALPSAVLFAAAAASIFINLAASHIFKKAVSFTKS